MSIFRRQQRFYPLFLLATAKSALTILTVKCRVFSDFDELSAEKFNGTQLSFVCIFLILDRNWRISAHTLRKVLATIELASQNLWSRYDRYFVSITWHNVWS